MHCDSGAAAYEFFAGGGMARLGLGDAWQVTFANDVDATKAAHYDRVFGAGVMCCADVWRLTADDLPGRASLAWASFPCQDLSLAGARGGLSAARSGAFWGFWRLIQGLAEQGRAPGLVVLENVAGLSSSGGGADLQALTNALFDAGYRAGALAIDAAWFTPQSRLRHFVVGFRGAPPAGLSLGAPEPSLHPEPRARAPGAAEPVWWRLPRPATRNTTLAALLDWPPVGVCWNSDTKTERLLALMSPLQRRRIEALRGEPGRHVGAVFRRMRSEAGVKVQRAEARFDGIAGCLRTPAGGSSRQTLLVIEEGRVRSRLLSPREGARLMGLPDDYPLPESQTAALHLLGDGVAAPVVRWLSAHLLEPLHAALAAPPALRAPGTGA
jgi:DNA (cytosine-5)-methyltransferase 1